MFPGQEIKESYLCAIYRKKKIRLKNVYKKSCPKPVKKAVIDLAELKALMEHLRKFDDEGLEIFQVDEEEFNPESLYSQDMISQKAAEKSPGPNAQQFFDKFYDADAGQRPVKK